jgi:hypothetical protein
MKPNPPTGNALDAPTTNVVDDELIPVDPRDTQLSVATAPFDRRLGAPPLAWAGGGGTSVLTDSATSWGSITSSTRSSPSARRCGR